MGDTSDSSGVVSNFETNACSIGHPNTTVVCMEKYMSTMNGHLTVQPGDVIEVVGSTDCGLLEGYIRGTTQTGFFPSHCVQEVQFRQKYISQVSTASTAAPNSNQQQQQQQQSTQLPTQSQSQQQITVQQSGEQVSNQNQQPPQQTMQSDTSQPPQPTTQFNSATAPRIKKK